MKKRELGSARRASSSRERLVSLVAVLALAFVVSLAVASGAQAYIYWSNTSRNNIGRATFDGSGVDQSFITSAQVVQGLAVDGAYVYWSNGYSIGRANLDGTGVDSNFIQGLSKAPRGLAVDSSHIYWGTEYGSARIGRANLDGSGVNENFIVGVDASGVAVDVAHIYWADIFTDTIGRANLNGSNAYGYFISYPGSASGVAVDAGHVYWSDWGTIGRANLDGTGQSTFITGANYAEGVAVTGTHVYWTNSGFESTSIGRANLDGSAVNQNFITGGWMPWWVAVDPTHRPNYMILDCQPGGVPVGGSIQCVVDVSDINSLPGYYGDPTISPSGTVTFSASGGSFSANSCTLNIYHYCGVHWSPPADARPGNSYRIEAHYSGAAEYLPSGFPYPRYVEIVTAGGKPPTGIPIVPSPTSAAGVVMINMLAAAMGWLLRLRHLRA